MIISKILRSGVIMKKSHTTCKFEINNVSVIFDVKNIKFYFDRKNACHITILYYTVYATVNETENDDLVQNQACLILIVQFPSSSTVSISVQYTGCY